TIAEDGSAAGDQAPGAIDRAFRTTVLPRLRHTGDGPPKLERTFAARYETLSALGEGGLGEVVLVKDNDIRRKVAMKKLKTGQQPASVHRFVEEIRLVGELDHPNIVPVHDVGIDEDGRFYFIMKYVEGETLEELIERLRSGDPEALAAYPPEVRIHIFLEILHAVRCAHQAGIIHRDIKPANIMIGRFGEAMVMDW